LAGEVVSAVIVRPVILSTKVHLSGGKRLLISDANDNGVKTALKIVPTKIENKAFILQ
jgi:hypothetical protein